jgi:hypothetical protein
MRRFQACCIALRMKQHLVGNDDLQLDVSSSYFGAHENRAGPQLRSVLTVGWRMWERSSCMAYSYGLLLSRWSWSAPAVERPKSPSRPTNPRRPQTKPKALSPLRSHCPQKSCRGPTGSNRHRSELSVAPHTLLDVSVSIARQQLKSARTELERCRENQAAEEKKATALDKDADAKQRNANSTRSLSVRGRAT